MAVEGAGEIGNGALHPLMTPAHVMILIGAGLLTGRQFSTDVNRQMRVFAPASAVALLLTLTGRVTGVHLPVLIGLALCLAILIAWDRKLPALVSCGLGAAAAVGIGLDSVVETGGAGGVIKTLVGTWLVMNALVFYLAICASHAEGRPWARTGIRVLGSWIIAISLMVLAFSLRK